jgi:hypothetical protein
MPNSLLDALLDGPFAMTPGPEPVPGDLRMGWGVALVVLMLGKSRARRASLQKLHFLAHSIRSHQARAEALEVFSRTRRPSDLLVRVEPWLNRALAIAKGIGLVALEGGRTARLTGQGEQVLSVLYEDESLFREEKQFLEAVSVQATEANIEKIMRMEPSL